MKLIELIPMFRTEKIAMNVVDDEATYVCDYEDLTEEDEYTHTLEVSSLCWLGWGWFPVAKSELEEK